MTDEWIVDGDPPEDMMEEIAREREAFEEAMKFDTTGVFRDETE